LAESKQGETFRVIDRRLFTEEGELRKDAIEQERREEQAAATRPQAAQPATTASERPSTKDSALLADDQAAGQGAGRETSTAAAETKQASQAFQMLVDFLTRNAAAMLGGVADPSTGRPFVDLEGAREMIDMLDALREKTSGNLARADDDLLVEVIGSLKLTFMEISKAASEAMAKKAKAKS